MKKIRLTYENGDTNDLRARLKGKVFHLTKYSSFTAIRRTGKILHNKDGRFGINTSSDNSFGRLMGYVCFFDLREHSNEIIERIHDDYPFSGPPWFERTRNGWTTSHIAYLLLNQVYYDRIIPNRTVHDYYNSTGQYLHFVPYGEVWIKDHVPLDWIESVILVSKKTRAPEPTSLAGILRTIGRKRRRKSS